jgi:protein-S-isoprenylcysteine O-methyltransferase Ste14
MSTSASAPVVAASVTRTGLRPWAHALLQLATRRRIAITAVVCAALVVCDVVLWKTRPCNLFDLTSGATIGGELLLLFGLLIRTWAAGTLVKRQDLVTQGPYQLVRNPLYIGSLLMMLGFSILARDWLAIWIVLGPVLAMYLNKVRQEERYLAHHHADDWFDYSRDTPRFFPEFQTRPSFAGFSFRQWAANHEYQALIGTALGLVALWCWHRAMA